MEEKDNISKCFEHMFLFIRVLSLNWVINYAFRVTWQVHSTTRCNIQVSQLLVLQLTHSIFMFRNLSLTEYRRG